jgi:hypothetical protein
MENDTELEKIGENLSTHGGKRPGSGRKAGVPNKISGTVKQNVLDVFQNLGGIEHMTAWALENPNQFYNIYAKILPTQTELSGPDGSELPLGIGITFVKPDDSPVSE